MPKTTKAALKSAVESFYYRYGWLTGGTAEEVRRQAPEGLKDLANLAAIARDALANGNAHCHRDAHLVQRVERMAQRLETYQARYLGTEEEAAEELDATRKRTIATTKPSDVAPWDKPEAPTEEQMRRLGAQWADMAKEGLVMREIKGTVYAFGTELATLRLLLKYRTCEKAAVGYSDTNGAHYFRLEL